MFDFARFGGAVGRGLGWPAESFLSAYNDNRLDATVATLEDSLVAGALLQLIGPVVKQWSGTPVNLHTALTQIMGKKVATSARWPKTSSKFGNELRRIAPQLRMHGVAVNFVRTHKGRFINLTMAGVPIISPTRATASPIKSSSEESGSDYSADTRKSNDGKAASP
jgi:hypothetical protein